MNERMNERMNKRKDDRMNRRTNELVNEWINELLINGWMDERVIKQEWKLKTKAIGWLGPWYSGQAEKKTHVQ